MGHAPVVSLLLFWGASVDAIDPEGRTVLLVAAAQGSDAVVNLLLERGQYFSIFSILLNQRIMEEVLEGP